jgi:hypothetical protein
MDDVKTKLKVPAIGLMIVGAADFFLGIVYTIGLTLMDLPELTINPDANNIAVNMIRVLIGIAVLSILFGPLIFWGAYQMLKGGSHEWAKASAILALLPIAVCSNPLGIAFGIWALVILGSADVKTYFARENISQFSPPQPPNL